MKVTKYRGPPQDVVFINSHKSQPLDISHIPTMQWIYNSFLASTCNLDMSIQMLKQAILCT